ncbi:MAG: hypothetical protein WBB29_06720 [Geitlerinemataceae cyanobacterium]
MKSSNSINQTKVLAKSSSAKSLASKKMRKMWDAEIARAWKEMQIAIDLNQGETSG